MPYIKQEKRATVDGGGIPDGPGELNYLITKLIMAYVRNAPLNYQAINDVLGALEGAKLEFYRRIAVPYENVKCAENGDVYDD